MANEKRLIDANALLGRLQKRREDFAGAWKTLDAMPINAQIQYHENLECSLIVEDVPIVDAVEVVHGYWIDSTSVDHMGRIVEHGIDCSVCESVFKDDSREVVKRWKERFEVCPFCGAVMDGGNEDV